MYVLCIFLKLLSSLFCIKEALLFLADSVSEAWRVKLLPSRGAAPHANHFSVSALDFKPPLLNSPGFHFLWSFVISWWTWHFLFRNVMNWKDANSTEIDPDTTHPVVIDMPEHNPGQMGGTMRLGKRTTIFHGDSISSMEHCIICIASSQNRCFKLYRENVRQCGRSWRTPSTSLWS